jgi:hypothetical protein
MYELIQATLTAAAEATVIIGITGIIAHALYTSHRNFMTEFCPPVTPYTPDTQETEAIASEPVSCPVDTDTHWESASPDGSSWEYASPLTCEWTAPAQPKRRLGRPQKQQPNLAEDLGLTPPSDWGKVQVHTRKTA